MYVILDRNANSQYSTPNKNNQITQFKLMSVINHILEIDWAIPVHCCKYPVAASEGNGAKTRKYDVHVF